MRFYNPIGIFLLLWPTLIALIIASDGKVSILLLLVFILGTVIMRSAGCIINDCADIDFDKHVQRTKFRPLANNEVTKKEAIYLLLFLLCLACLCLLALNKYTVKLSFIAFLLSLLYPFTKRYFHIPQIFLGVTFSFGILMAYTAVLNYLPIDAWILFSANLFWIMAYDTIYAIVDKEDDKKIPIYSSALTFGKYDTIFVIIFYIIFDILLIFLAFSISSNIYFYLSILLVFFLECIIIYKIINQSRTECFTAFLQNNYIGLVLFIGTLLNFMKII